MAPTAFCLSLTIDLRWPIALCVIAVGACLIWRAYESFATIYWTTLCRRTNDPKLRWIQRRLDERDIPNRRNGESFHAPILEVDERRLGDAWEILEPIDDEPDNLQKWHEDGCATEANDGPDDPTWGCNCGAEDPDA